MISIINKPVSAITGDTSNTSKWVGAHQPIEFEIQRKDYDVSAISTMADGVRKRIMINKTIDISIGDNFNYVCGEFGERSFSLTVSNFLYSWGKTYIYFSTTNILDIDKISINKAFILLERTSYYIETFVYMAKEDLKMELKGVVRSLTNDFGRAKVNIQKIISSNIENYNSSNYDKINVPIPNQGGIYNIQCREVYQDYIGGFTSLLPTDNLYYVNGCKQLQDPNNYNFGEYVPTLNNSRESKAKFLSVFDKPTFFRGYPFDISFIYSDNMQDKQLSRVENVGGTETSTSLFTNGRGFVNRLKLSESYASTVDSITLHLTSGFATTQSPVTGVGGLFEPGTVATPYTASIYNNFNYTFEGTWVDYSPSSYDKPKINDFLNAPSY